MSKLTKTDVIERLAKLSFIMVDESLYINTNTRMLIKCNIHNITWESTVGDAYRLTKCACECKYKTENYTDYSREKLSKEEVVAKVNSRGFQLLNKDEFKNTRMVGNFKCNKGHDRSCYIHNVYSEKSGCPKCSTTTGERRCRFILETIFKKPFIRTRDVVKIDGKRLELDMYNEELMTACEYSGIQHFVEDKKFFHKEGGFEEQVERDSLKKKYCDDNGIKLIIVPYTIYKFMDTVNFILSELNITNDSLDINWDIKQIEYTTLSDNNILTTTKMRSEMDDVADKRNAKYLGITNNGQRSLHKFLCEDGHEFKLQASDINRGRWCWDCSGRKPLSTSTVSDMLAKINMSLIGEYVNSRTNITIKCNNCENEFEKKWDNIKQRELDYGCCCICNSSNIKVAEINEKLEKIGLKFADKLYVDAKTKHTYECEKGHVIACAWNTIKVRSGKCKECKKNIKQKL
jgi:hypothetical protein